MSAAASLPLLVAALLAIAFGLTGLTVWYWRVTDPDRRAIDTESVRLARIPELRVDPADDGSVLGPIPSGSEIPALFRIDVPPPVLAHRAATETVEVDTLAILEAKVRADTFSPNMLARRPVDVEVAAVGFEPPPVERHSPVVEVKRETLEDRGPVRPDPVTATRFSHEPAITDSDFFAGFSLQEWSSVVGSVLANLSAVENRQGTGSTIDIDDRQPSRQSKRTALSTDTTLRS